MNLDELAPDDRYLATCWLDRAANTPLDKLRFELELLTRNHQPAFQWLVDNVALAANMARDAGWLPTLGAERTPDEIAHVEALTRAVVDALTAAEQRDAEALRARLEELGVKPRGPRHLSPEQLDQLNPLPNGHKRAHPNA